MKKRLTKSLPVLLAISLAMTGLSGCGEKTTYEYTIEQGTNYVFDATEIFGVSEKEAEEYDPILTNLDTNTAGKYEVKVVKGNKEYTVIYTVEDTKAPEVKMVEKYIFTNNIDKTDFTKLVDMKDASEVTEKLCKFKKLDDMKVLSLDVVKTYTKEITGTATTEELLERLDDPIGTDGIYNAVYVAEDAYGHKTAKEVIVIYDTQNPTFAGVENIPQEIEVDDVNAEWTDSMANKLAVTDNCDGVIAVESLDVKMELTNASTHTYKVDVSYTDRAGNTAGAQYSFSLKEKAVVTPNTNTGSGNANTGSGNSNTGNSNTGNGGSTTTKPAYSYDDLDGDGYADLGPVTEMNGFLIDTEDVTPQIAKNDLALSEAGYWNPILLDSGTYMMIIPYGEDYWDFFDKWLQERGIWANSMGCSPWDKEGKAQQVGCSDYILIEDIPVEDNW